MKVTVPLSLKVSLWLLLNLAVLLGAAVVFVSLSYGVGWHALFASPAGARVQDLGRLVAADLRANPQQSPDDMLQRYAPEPGTDLLLFLNDGRQLGGPATTLPPAVRGLLPGPRVLGGPDGEREPPPRPAGFDAERPPPALPRPGSDGRGVPVVDSVRRAGRPAAYWILVRIPVVREDAVMPAPGTLVIRVPSALGLLRLLNFGPWLAAAAAAFLISVICWLPFVSGLRRALLDLTRATGRIAEGHFETRVQTHRRDELGALGHSVDQMAGRLEAHVETQKRFLGDVAHELGTPLARLQIAIELLQRKAPGELHVPIADVREEVEQVTVLVNELLAFTKAGLRRPDAALATVDVAAVVSSVLARESAAARVQVAVAPDAFALADAALLERALANLVRNALRYAADSAVTISAEPDGRELIIRVTDAGPGVPPEAFARLGEPFYRPDTARTRETGGTGLGLAIVRTCIEACHGSVAFRPRDPHGFIAEIRLTRPE